MVSSRQRRIRELQRGADEPQPLNLPVLLPTGNGNCRQGAPTVDCVTVEAATNALGKRCSIRGATQRTPRRRRRNNGRGPGRSTIETCSRPGGPRHFNRTRPLPPRGPRHFNRTEPLSLSGPRHFNRTEPLPVSGPRHFNRTEPLSGSGLRHFNRTEPLPGRGLRQFNRTEPLSVRGLRQFNRRKPLPVRGRLRKNTRNPHQRPRDLLPSRFTGREGPRRPLSVDGRAPLQVGPCHIGPAVSRDAAASKFAGVRERTGPAVRD